jgi:putative ABC transport system permease protein
MTAGGVPVARRQLLSEPAKVAVAVLAVGAAVALVLLLTGLRRGMGEQVTTYLRHEPPVLVGQEGTRNFLSQTSVLPESEAGKVAQVPGVAAVAPISQGYAMLNLHGRHILTVLVGYEPGSVGGPWSLAEGRVPGDDELVLDRTLASEHGLRIGSVLDVRGRSLRIVGLSSGTSGFMTPLAFTTRATANALNEQPQTATFLLVRPRPGVAPAALAAQINSAVPGVSALERDELAAHDRDVFVGAFSGPLTAMTTIAGAVAALGTAVGVVFALAAVRGVAVIAPKYLIALAPRDALAMALAALVFALLAGLVPARYLANLDPATAFHR